MSLDFFKTDCQSPAITVSSFGLCDDQNGTKAYPDTKNPDTWIAEVKNDTHLDIIFTAVDKCVLNDNEHIGRGRCDGMLTTNNHLYLVELKNERKDWQSGAVEQLISTIQFLLDNHDISKYKKRKAFACNKKHKVFAETDNEINLTLFRQTGFRLDIQAEIVVI